MNALHGRARGAAVVMALLIVALAATLVTGLFWRQHVLARSVENNLAYTQSKWLMLGALDWARIILAEDARTSNTDHLGEPWAVPIANTRVTEEGVDEPAYISGSLEDAQSRFNLVNLIRPDSLTTRELDCLKRLLRALDLNPSIADTILKRLRSAQPYGLAAADATQDQQRQQSGPGGQPHEQPNQENMRRLGEEGEAVIQPTATLPRTVEDLIGEPGIDAQVVARLKPYVTFLPLAKPVNANTASAEVLAARIDGLSLAQARQLVASRQQFAFRDRQDVLNRLPRSGGDALQATEQDIDVKSEFFMARGQVTFRRAELRVEALIAREEQGVPAIVWQREVW